MAFIYSPQIYNGTSTLQLPLPILSLPLRTLWKFKETKVPRRAGSKTYGEVRDSYVLSIQGEVAQSGVGGTVYGNDEEAQWTAIEALIDHINVTNGDKSLEFFWYFDDSSAETYRKHKNVLPQGVVVDVGDGSQRKFTYQLDLLITDPVIYDTAPGA